MCFTAAKWKREQVQDHKFDFVDIKDFKEKKFSRKITYSFVFIIVLKSVLVYVIDLWNAGILLLSPNGWGSSIKPKISISTSKWIFLGSILASFLLLALDMKKARSIIASRDISYTFTNTIAYRFYTLRSYSHYCFFCQINNSRKKTDSIAYFVFFTFKGWKRLLFADAPRQAINAFTLFSIFQTNKSKFLDLNSYESISNVQMFAMFGMLFTVLMFIISATLLLVAFLLYIPLLCHIRGNLKEYCCHKIDKRIRDLLKKKSKKRLQQKQLEAEAEAKGDFRHFKNKSARGMDQRPLREPTLPTLEFADEYTPPYGAPPPQMSYPYYLNAPPPPTFDDRMMNRSPEPMNMYPPPTFDDRMMNRSPEPMNMYPPPYISRPNTPGYNQRVPSPAAGQRPSQYKW